MKGLFAHFCWSTLKYAHIFFSVFYFLEGLLYRRQTSYTFWWYSQLFLVMDSVTLSSFVTFNDSISHISG